MQLVNCISHKSNCIWNTFLAFFFISSLFVLNTLESEIMGTINSSRIFCASCNGLFLCLTLRNTLFKILKFINGGAKFLKFLWNFDFIKIFWHISLLMNLAIFFEIDSEKFVSSWNIFGTDISELSSSKTTSVSLLIDNKSVSSFCLAWLKSDSGKH